MSPDSSLCDTKVSINHDGPFMDACPVNVRTSFDIRS
jgi:hypothetical protein